MRKIRTALVLALAPAVCPPSVLRAADEKLVWLDAPATHFTESLPLGNGRLGAVVFGGVAEERIVLNETGLWSGSPHDADRPDAYKSLPEIRRLLLAGKNVEAEALVNKNFTSAGTGSGRGRGANLPYGRYQVLGSLRLKFLDVPPAAAVTNYRRELNLADATARVTYEVGGVKFTREIFVSAPDEVIAIRLTASRPAALNFDLALDRPENFTTAAPGPDRLLMTGQLSDGKQGTDGVRYAARLRALMRSGSLDHSENALQIRDADDVILLLSAVTDIKIHARAHRVRRVFRPHPLGALAGALADRRLDAAETAVWAEACAAAARVRFRRANPGRWSRPRICASPRSSH